MTCPIKEAYDAVLEKRRRRGVSKKQRNAKRRAELMAEKVVYPQPFKQGKAKKQSYKKKTSSRRKSLNSLTRLLVEYREARGIATAAEDLENLNCMQVSTGNEKSYRLLEQAFKQLNKNDVWLYSYEPNNSGTWEVVLSRGGWSTVLHSLNNVIERLILAKRAASGFKNDKRLAPVSTKIKTKKAPKPKGYKKKVYVSKEERSSAKKATGKTVGNLNNPPVYDRPLMFKGPSLVGGKGPLVSTPTKGQKPVSRKARLREEAEMRKLLKVESRLELHMVLAAA